LPIIEKQLQTEPKIILLYGPRQAGKTTLIHEVTKNIQGVVFLTGDDVRTQELFSVPNLDQLRAGVGGANMLVIDEAQRISDIGLSLKLLFDDHPLPIIASGSSSFDLANKVNEPLTGRAVTYELYPLSLLEIPVTLPDTSVVSHLEDYLRFGMYPKVVTTVGDTEKIKYLNDLMNLYLYKDILTFENVRKPKKVIDLLSLLALQIGSEVSVRELSEKLGISHIVVEKYLDLLEKMFVIVNVRGFSRNLRKEITITSNFYFFDFNNLTSFSNASIRFCKLLIISV
jgi:predicted AAA+ superfamily ATPase